MEQREAELQRRGKMIYLVVMAVLMAFAVWSLFDNSYVIRQIMMVFAFSVASRGYKVAKWAWVALSATSVASSVVTILSYGSPFYTRGLIVVVLEPVVCIAVSIILFRSKALDAYVEWVKAEQLKVIGDKKDEDEWED